MSEIRGEEPKNTSRRNFIKLSAGAALAGALMRLPRSKTQGFPDPEPTLTPEPTPTPEPFFLPEQIHGVEVYGLQNKIGSKERIFRLYEHLDKKFCRETGLEGLDVREGKGKAILRESILNSDERYLEVVVRRSAYESFLARQSETQVDFVQWIKMHVDSMNLTINNAKPPSEMKVVLRRIIVIEDSLPKDWKEKDWREGKTCALDLWYRNKFYRKAPLDTDASWAVADDYRADTKKETIQGFFWSYYHDEKGNVIYRHPPGGNTIEKTYQYPSSENSLSGKDNVWLDWGMIHEWMHRALNLPDQYVFDQHNCYPSTFEKFLVLTGGSFQEPMFSPYLAYFLGENRKKGRRSRDFQWQTRNFTERPRNVFLTINSSGGKIDGIGIYKIRVKGSYYGEKIFPQEADQAVLGSSLKMDQELFDDRPDDGAHLWLVRAKTEKGTKDLFLPAMAFQMSYFAGVWDQANYQIEFEENSDKTKNNLGLEMVYDTDLDIHLALEKFNEEGKSVYAKMKVEGTPVLFVWVLF